jgi:hypothetical protein
VPGRVAGVIGLVVWGETSRRCPLGGRTDIALGQQQPRPLRRHRVEQGGHLRAQPGLPGLVHRLHGPGRVTVRVPDPGHNRQADGQRWGVAKLPGQRDSPGGVVQGGVQLVPLVQDLGQAHVPQAHEGCRAALAESVQRLPIGRQRRIQVALGALHLAQDVVDVHGEKPGEEPGANWHGVEDLRGLAACAADRFAGRPTLGEHLCQAALGWPEPAGQPVHHRPVPAHEGAHQPLVFAQVRQGLPEVAGRKDSITAQPRE